ncbi:MAG: cell division protein SepF [Erysipelotrichaceae bacterium]|nr:cell division protein SepF [Erysipelotrichaceae bacterium]
MGLTDKIKDFIAPAEEEEELELNEEEARALSAYEEPQDASASKISAATNIVLFEPRNFDEAEEIGRHIKHRRACCINLRRMPNEYRQRIIDFLSGVIYGVDGTIKKIDDNVILCSPKNLQVAGNIGSDNGSNY